MLRQEIQGGVTPILIVCNHGPHHGQKSKLKKIQPSQRTSSIDKRALGQGST